MWKLQETRVWSLGREGPLGKEVATHSNILAWDIPWTEEPDGLQSMGLQKSLTQLSDWVSMYQKVWKDNMDWGMILCITSEVDKWDCVK